jgi:hypothetical protein
VQPIIAKQILPWFGGSAAVWTTCLVFFQSVLLAGYAYADWTSRLGARRQAMLHVALLVASLLCLPILASSGWKPHGDEQPVVRILLLGATIGLPYSSHHAALSRPAALARRRSIGCRALEPRLAPALIGFMPSSPRSTWKSRLGLVFPVTLRILCAGPWLS